MPEPNPILSFLADLTPWVAIGIAVVAYCGNVHAGGTGLEQTRDTLAEGDTGHQKSFFVYVGGKLRQVSGGRDPIGIHQGAGAAAEGSRHGRAGSHAVPRLCGTDRRDRPEGEQQNKQEYS